MIIKNVGVNACADPLLQATVQGLKGGVLLVVGDDPEAKGSQTAQDSRYYGELAQFPVIQPDETTCVTGVEAALGASEKFSRVAMLRWPPAADAEVTGGVVCRNESQGRLADRTWTMHGRVTAAEEVHRTMFAWSDASSRNRWKGGTSGPGLPRESPG